MHAGMYRIPHSALASFISNQCGHETHERSILNLYSALPREALGMDMDSIINAVMGIGVMMETDFKLDLDTDMDIKQKAYKCTLYKSQSHYLDQW